MFELLQHTHQSGERELPAGAAQDSYVAPRAHLLLCPSVKRHRFRHAGPLPLAQSTRAPPQSVSAPSKEATWNSPCCASKMPLRCRLENQHSLYFEDSINCPGPTASHAEG